MRSLVAGAGRQRIARTGDSAAGLPGAAPLPVRPCRAGAARGKAGQDCQKHKRSEAGRKYGAGRPRTLPHEDGLHAGLTILGGVITDAAAQIFSVSADATGRAFDEVPPAVTKALGSPQEIFWHAARAGPNGDIRKWMSADKGAADGAVVNTSKPADKDAILEYSRHGKGAGLNVPAAVDGDGQLSWTSGPSLHPAAIRRPTRSIATRVSWPCSR